MHQPDYSITVKRKTNRFVVFFIGMWFIGLCYMLQGILSNIFNGTDKATTPVIGFVIFFGLVTLYGLRMLLWQLRGREKITVVNDQLRIEKLGTFLVFPIKYQLSEIQGFYLQKKKRVQSAEVFWGLAGGKIRFRYRGRNRNFGQTLTKTQATEICDELNERLRMAHAVAVGTGHN